MGATRQLPLIHLECCQIISYYFYFNRYSYTLEDTGMAGRVREQRSEEGEGRRRKLSPWIRFIIGGILILLVTGLLLLWVLNSLGFIQKPLSTFLTTIFSNIYTFIVSVGALIVGIISANSKEVFQKFFPNSANSESAKAFVSSTTTPVTPGGSQPEDATQSQHDKETVSDNRRIRRPQRTLQLEIIEPEPIMAMQAASSSIFLFNEHLPGPEEFYGRKLECEALINRTRRGASTSIVGLRRIGKTWLAEYLMHIAPTELGPNYRVGYLDATLPGCKTVSGFTASVLEQIGIRVTPNDADLSLETLLEAVDKLRAKNLLPILCIDEFEGLNNREEFEKTFFAGLRAISQRGLGLITVSKTTLFDIVGNDGYTSGFFNIFDTYTLKPFVYKEAKEFVQIKGDQANLTKQERTYLLRYGQQQGQPQWPPLRLQLAGKMLLEDKEGGNSRPDDVDYWLDFKERLEIRYNAVVH